HAIGPHRRRQLRPHADGRLPGRAQELRSPRARCRRHPCSGGAREAPAGGRPGSADGLRAAGRSGSGARAPGGARRRVAARRRLMGSFAEDCAQKYAFTREAQDQFAIASLTRAQKANNEGWFAWELTPLAIKVGKEEKFVETDEQPFKANLEKIATLKPAFRKDGTVTAANSSSISDGAAALVMMRRSSAERRGLAPLAVVVGQSTHAQEPGW